MIDFMKYQGSISQIVLDLASMARDMADLESSYECEASNAFFELMQCKYSFDPERDDHNQYLIKATTDEALDYALIQSIKSGNHECSADFLNRYTMKGWKAIKQGTNNYLALNVGLHEDEEIIAYIAKASSSELPDHALQPVTVTIETSTSDYSADFDTIYEAHEWVCNSALNMGIKLIDKEKYLALDSVRDSLSDSYRKWCHLEGLPWISMDELIAKQNELTEKQHKTVRAFYELWMELDY